MKIRLLALAVLSCSIALAQTPPDSVVKIVRVHGDPATIAKLALIDSGVHFQFSEALHTIVLRGNASNVASAERTIQEVDTASPSPAVSRNVETTVYLITGSAEPISGAQEVTGEALTPVVKQLRAIFPYQHYQPLSTMLLRSAQDTKANTEGLMKSFDTPPEILQPSRYTISYESVRVSPESLIHLTNFQFSASIPYITGRLRSNTKDGSIPYATTQFQETRVGVRADIDLREGQKVVVGKANVTDSDTCFFIVLSARLLP
jgi:hypothetical protein